MVNTIDISYAYINDISYVYTIDISYVYTIDISYGSYGVYH